MEVSPMRFVIQLLVVSFLFTALESGFEAHAQTTGAAASHDEEEDLRKTVRELALRVSALEEELHRQRAATPVDSVSLKPPAPVLSAMDFRSSVESISSSGVAEAAPVAA